MPVKNLTSKSSSSLCALVAATAIALVPTATVAQLATSPAPVPVQVPEVTVTAPAEPVQAAPRPPKAPSAAQQSSTPRAAPKAAPAPEPVDVQPDPSAVTVAPTGNTVPVEQIGSSVTVVTSQEIEAQQRRTAPDVLKSVPGVNVVQSGGPGALTSVFIRGANPNHSKVLIDGIDVSDPSSANRTFDFSQLTSFDIDRIEVLRGPQSGLYGADALGGVVVVYTKKGEGPLKVDALVEGGSFGTLNEAVSARGSTDRLNYAFNIGHYKVDKILVTPLEILQPGVPRLKNNYDNWTYSTKLGVDVTPDVMLNFVARYTDKTYGFQGSGFDDTKSITTSQQLFTRGEAVWSLFGGRMKNYFGINYANLTTDNVSPFGGSFNNGDRIKYDVRSVMEIARGLVVTTGADYQTERFLAQDLAAEETNTGIYTQVQLEPVHNLFLVGNLRHDDNDNFGIANTWRFAPAYLLEATGTKFKGSAGTGFKAPSLAQRFQDFPPFFFGNRNLKAEESTGYDIGFEQTVFNNRAQFGATWFYNDLRDLIVVTSDPATFVTSLDNVVRAKTSGMEVFGSADITDDLRLRGDYTYTEAKDASTGIDLIRRPRHKATVSVGWKPSAPWLLTGSVTYIGPSLDRDRAQFLPVFQPGFTLVNVAADYKVNDHMSVFGRIDNLFDKQYQNPNGYEGTGIGAYAGVKFNN